MRTMINPFAVTACRSPTGTNPIYQLVPVIAAVIYIHSLLFFLLLKNFSLTVVALFKHLFYTLSLLLPGWTPLQLKQMNDGLNLLFSFLVLPIVLWFVFIFYLKLCRTTHNTTIELSILFPPKGEILYNDHVQVVLY